MSSTPTPLPVSLTITIRVDPPVERIPAHVVGREIAKRTGTTFIGSHHSGDDPARVGWTLAVDEGGPIGDILRDLEQTIPDVVREIDGREDTHVRVVELQALASDEVERRLARSGIPDMVGVDEFAELCGVKRARLYQLRDTDEAFPQPVARGVYLRVTVERYARNRDSARTA
jgi:hypothetical protein